MEFRDYVITTEDRWTAKQLCEYSKQGVVTFDNVVQRNLVWNRRQKSLLIHSLIFNFSPPEFLANKKNGIFDMIDGKQRHNAIASFINNEYKLIGVPDHFENGEVYVLNDKYFKDLDPKVQDKITGRSLKISVMDNATQDQIKEYFYRRNNGTPLTAARKSFAQAKSFEEIIHLSRHPIFDVILTGRARLGDESKNIVQRSYVILNCENKSLESKKVSPYIKNAAFTENGVKTVVDCYDAFLEVYNILKDIDEKANKKFLTKMRKKTNMLTLLPILKMVNDNKIEYAKVADWICYFFAPIEKTSVDEVYNENAKAGSSKVGAVEARIKAMEDSLLEFATK
jgi:hypothetical protein